MRAEDYHGDEPEQQADEHEARERKWDEEGDEE